MKSKKLWAALVIMMLSFVFAIIPDTHVEAVTATEDLINPDPNCTKYCPGHGHVFEALSTCSSCSGTGKKYDSCTNANCNNGKVTTYICNNCGRNNGRNGTACSVCGSSSFKTTSTNCTTCGGDGYLDSYTTCTKCDGHGKNTRCTNTSCSLHYYDWHNGGSVDGTCYTCSGCKYYSHIPASSYYTTAHDGYYYRACTRCGQYIEKYANPYTVTYNSNGGSGSMNNQSVLYSNSFKLSPCLFAKTGYSFNAWVCSEDGKTYSDKQSVSNLTKIYNRTVTMTASWKANTYTVSFSGNGGIPQISSMSVTYGEAYGELPTATREGYTFLGWFTRSEGGVQIKDTTKVSIAENHTLYAHFQVNKFTVTYNGNGGTPQINTKEVAYGSSIDLTPTAEKEGYVLVGWGTSSSATKPISSMEMPAHDVTLYAIYSIPVSDIKEVYFVTWDADGSSYWGSYDTKVYKMDRIESYNLTYRYFLPTTTVGVDLRDGEIPYGVVVLDNAGNDYLIAGTTPPEPLIFYLQTVNHYRYDVINKKYVLFDTTTQSVLKGETFTPEYVTPPAGYKEYSISSPYKVTSKKTTSAYYQPMSFTLYFDGNGGESELDSKAITFGDYYGELPTAYREGYTFLGWFTEAEAGEEIKSSYQYMIEGDSTLYAHWRVNSYKIIYDYYTNGGTSADVEYLSVNYGSPVDLSVKGYKSGWKFVGWNTNPSAKTGLTSLTMKNEDTILYAIYSKTIAATFIDRGDVGTVKRTLSTTIYNKEIYGTIEVPTQSAWSGWRSLGYSLSKSAAGEIAVSSGGSCKLEYSTTFYGRYSKDITLSYDTNGSLIEIPAVTQECVYNASGATIAPSYVIAEAPTLESHSFKFWKKLSSGNIVATYVPGQEVQLREDTLLVAEWDAFPEITAYDRYFTLEEAKSGAITQAALLAEVVATDKEDGTLENGSSVIVRDYRASEFTSFNSTGSVSVTYQATDSFGNSVSKLVMIHIIDTSAKVSNKVSYMRFISPEFYKSGDSLVAENAGGLANASLWRTDESYNATLDYAMSNVKNDVEDEEINFRGRLFTVKKVGTGTWEHLKASWYFTHEEILKMDEFIDTYGFGRFKAVNAIETFYEWYGECKKE